MRVNVLTSRTGGPLRWGKDLTVVLNSKGIEAKHFHALPSLAVCPIYQAADIVHTTVPLPFKLWRKPLVLTIHGEYIIERNIWQRFYPKTIAQADLITVPSRYLKEKLNLSDAIVIPNALFPERFSLAKHGTKEQLNLISVMNFYFGDKVEGVIRIIDILSRLNRCHFRHSVIGGGPYLGTVKKRVSVSNKAIQFTGFLPDPRPYLAASDIFLHYSHHDNFPTVILEAMASGLPVITNNVGAVAEIIDNGCNGYIAENDEAYLTYLVNLLDSPMLRHNIGFKARRSVEKRFNWTELGSEYVKVYNAMFR